MAVFHTVLEFSKSVDNIIDSIDSGSFSGSDLNSVVIDLERLKEKLMEIVEFKKELEDDNQS